MQSPKGSTFFRSTTSLATTSFLRLPLTSSSHNSKSEKRRFFSSKSREKHPTPQSPPEALEAWEELSVDDAADETPTSLLSVVESACSCVSSSVVTSASPTRSVSFTYGAQVPDAFRSLHASLPAPAAPQPHTTTPAPPSPAPPPAHPRQEHTASDVHPLSLLDRKTPFIQRPIRRSPAPTPPRIQVPIPVPLEPVLTTVRTRLPQNQPPAAPPPSLAVPPQPVLPRNIAVTQVTRPSPLSQESFSPPETEVATADPSFWKAVETPLPSTPVLSSFPTSNGSPTTPTHAAQAPVAQPARPDDKSVECGVSNWERPPLLEQPPVFSRAPSPFVEEPITPTRHHYPGRPLPRTPGYSRGHIDSTFAPNEEFEATFIPALTTCPEGLLIDLDDDKEPGEEEGEDISTTFTDDLVDLSPASESTVTPNVFCPTPLPTTLESLTFMPATSSTPPPQIRVDSNSPGTNASGYSNLTDLDLFVSHLISDEQRPHDGTQYDVSCSSVPPTPGFKAAQGGVGEADGGLSRRKHQSLNVLPIEGSTFGSGIRWPREPSPSRISWRKPISADLTVRGSENGGSNNNPSIVGNVPSRVILDNHPRQLQWQHLPARVH
ncbi:hypothetical protein EST38_g9673 [Candolleomyces aberdarensis]|uniref:Uncharacterized protein n=1 Tax=Candolleomyces aberdarensis TaxID=2316362 RepID=A0A4Q2DBP7_9AGAR|nr:hypothetical protein EST38_g9673 [Candolleomyces aberdarensis]